jgi:indolepyruvate ferredoxin oxidoreductase, beta subunit
MTISSTQSPPSNMEGELKKILILALGGEGGGTLTEWVVEAGLASRWPIQATSIPGVAQRTGATSYYIECLPRRLDVGFKVPPMCLAPLAGELDLIVSSELLESARALERGLADRSRTKVVSSTARALTVDERTAMGEGRLASNGLMATVQAGSLQAHLFDMTAMAKLEGTMVSAVMFGSLVGSGVLPFDLELCRAVIVGAEGDAASPRAQASLRGFMAGFAEVSGRLGLIGVANLHEQAQAAVSSEPIPAALQEIVRLAMERLRDFQDQAYAETYRSMVERLAALDHAPLKVTQEAARGLALWMAYEDVIRVADLKSRRSRFEQIRADYKAKPDEPVIVRDFLKPGVEEIAAILPDRMARALLTWAKRRKLQSIGEGLQLRTSSVGGLLTMRLLASLRRWRRRSSRFAHEQALIGRWTKALEQALSLEDLLLAAAKTPGQSGVGLAHAVAQMPRLIKGYSDTFARGHGNFVRMLEHLLEPGLKGLQLSLLAPHAPQEGVGAVNLERAQKVLIEAQALAERLSKSQSAALSHPDGHEFFRAIGLERPEPAEQVIHFARPVKRSKS